MTTNNEKKYDNMKHIEEAITAFSVSSEEYKSDRVFDILESIRAAINNQEMFILPVELPLEAVDMIDPEHVKVGDVVSVKEDLRLRILSVHLQDGASALAAFTSQEEVRKGEDVSTITSDIEEFLQYVLMNPNVEGVVINPWGNVFFLPKDFIKIIFEANVPAEQENMICFDTMDITMAETVCIVNAANKSLLGGGGVDGAIHRAAGPKLLEECKTLHGCNTGEAKLTKGYNLKADYVIHTVGPIYNGSSKDAQLLKNCYWNCLELTRENNIHSITFPAISMGVYGYPLREATEIALKTASDWLMSNPHYGMAIMFACFDDKTKTIYETIWKENEVVRSSAFFR